MQNVHELLFKLCSDCEETSIDTHNPRFILTTLSHSLLKFLIYDEKEVLYHSRGDSAIVNGLLAFALSDPFKDYPALVLDEKYGQRPIISGQINLSGTEVLHSDGFEILQKFRKQGLGSRYYQYLHELALAEGYRFVIGRQTHLNAAKYFLEQGRYLQEEIKQEAQTYLGFNPDVRDPKIFNTVMFLNQDDLVDAILPERLEQSVVARMQQKILDQQIHNFLQRVSSVTRAQQLREQYFSADVVLDILIAVDELHLFLPDSDRSPIDLGGLLINQVKNDPTSTLQSILEVIAHLRHTSWDIATSPKKKEVKKFLNKAMNTIEAETPYDDGFDSSTDFD